MIRVLGRLRWFEPLGQMIVLIAVGLQFFSLAPAIEESSQATTGYIIGLLEQHTLPEHPERGQEGLARMRAELALKDAEVTAQKNKIIAAKKKEESAAIYIRLFVLGSVLAILGKLGSVAYSTKSSASPKVVLPAQTLSEGSTSNDTANAAPSTSHGTLALTGPSNVSDK